MELHKAKECPQGFRPRAQSVSRDRLVAVWTSFMGGYSAAPIAALCGLTLDKKLKHRLVLLDREDADVDQVAKALGVTFFSESDEGDSILTTE